MGKRIFLGTKWYRVILNEAQVIKNCNTKAARGVFSIEGMYRWSLSGTPMQNCVDEIYSQIAFLRIPPYCEWELFRKTFILGFKQADSRHDVMRKFQALLRAILLRRTKKSKIDAVDIVQGLPDKTIRLVYVVFDERQLEVYRTLESGAVDQMNKYQTRGMLGRNYTNALTLLLRLRQACLHPYLVRSTGSVDEEQVRLAKGFDAQTCAENKRERSIRVPDLLRACRRSIAHLAL